MARDTSLGRRDPPTPAVIRQMVRRWARRLEMLECTSTRGQCTTHRRHSRLVLDSLHRCSPGVTRCRGTEVSQPTRLKESRRRRKRGLPVPRRQRAPRSPPAGSQLRAKPSAGASATSDSEASASAAVASRRSSSGPVPYTGPYPGGFAAAHPWWPAAPYPVSVSQPASVDRVDVSASSLRPLPGSRTRRRHDTRGVRRASRRLRGHLRPVSATFYRWGIGTARRRTAPWSWTLCTPPAPCRHWQRTEMASAAATCGRATSPATMCAVCGMAADRRV